MASISELKDVLKETLEQNGTLARVRAEIRASIFNTLNDNTMKKAQLSNQNLLVNELIRQYLQFNGYQHTLAVFLPETGQPTRPAFDRDFITKKLRVAEDQTTRSLPLLYALTFGVKKVIKEDQRPVHEGIYGD